MGGRALNFVYFGGGTPSFLSTRQLEGLVERLKATMSVGPGRRSHVRVRAGHADGAEAGDDPRDRRHAAQPRRRELRRQHPRSQRPGPSIAGDQARLCLCPLARLPADQHRPDRRHGRRDRGQLARLHREDARARARQRHDLPDGAAVQHDDQQRHPARAPAGSRPAPRTGRRSAGGPERPSPRSSAPGITSAAPTPRSRTRPARVSSIAIDSGRAPIWSGWAWRRSATSAACTSRISTPGSSTARRSVRTRFRSAAPTDPPTKSG